MTEVRGRKETRRPPPSSACILPAHTPQKKINDREQPRSFSHMFERWACTRITAKKKKKKTKKQLTESRTELSFLSPWQPRRARTNDGRWLRAVRDVY